YRSLTRTLPQTPDTRADSILSLFDGGASPPTGLTEFDRAYLSELYKGAANLPAPASLARLEAATGRDIFIEEASKPPDFGVPHELSSRKSLCLRGRRLVWGRAGVCAARGGPRGRPHRRYR